MLSYPTPTWLYRCTRWLAEATGQWIFHDERLRAGEVLPLVERHGVVLRRDVVWSVVLTQEMVCVRKHI